MERIRNASRMSLAYYGKPLAVMDNGGKDSSVCRELVRRSGVPHEIMHNLTTADAPQIVNSGSNSAQSLDSAVTKALAGCSFEPVTVNFAMGVF